ncbi:MAG: ABC transporter substrate-binding protein [Comamonadaceae bacterium CG12_big_fil_rev_8_21_14_0_65_59_15]|nr:MAG: ABC transporter substrate-binding protein [Comamonadaceae bacterium CG12_big_fil_rev_8_21_14_0_65_59_15]
MMITLRKFLLLIWLFAWSLSAWAAAGSTIRIAMTPAFLHDQHAMLAQWRDYLQSQLKRPVEFIQRDRYRETIDLLQQQKVDFAWICDYPYLVLKDDVKLLAVALHQGKPNYQAYLIVPATDKTTRSIADLKGSIFAYADPYSNTGYLVPRFEIKRGGADPATFFRRTFFTWSHRKVIDAVASGVAQGASVDSYVWESLAKVRPDITAKTRIAWKSALFGFPPMVAQRNVSAADFKRMQQVLMDMQNHPQGLELLKRLNLDGFVPGSPQLYDGVVDMMRQFGEP